MWLWKKIIRNNHRLYLANSNTEASNHLRWCCMQPLLEKLSYTFLWWEANFPREYEEQSKVTEQAYTVLKLSINDTWSPAEELPLLILLSREVQHGEVQLQASSFPGTAGTGPPPCPTYPSLGLGTTNWAGLCRTGSLAKCNTAASRWELLLAPVPLQDRPISTIQRRHQSGKST